MQIGIDNDYLAGNLQDYEYFPKNFKLIVIDISKQKELQNLSNTQKRYFLENIEYDGGPKMSYKTYILNASAYTFTIFIHS